MNENCNSLDNKLQDALTFITEASDVETVDQLISFSAKYDSELSKEDAEKYLPILKSMFSADEQPQPIGDDEAGDVSGGWHLFRRRKKRKE